jgi:peroxiredoxin
VFCHEHVRALRDEYAKFTARGLDVAVVTQGPPERAAELKARHQLPFRCLADPKLDAYRAFGLARGSLMQIANPVLLARAALSALRGNIGAPGGDLFQMPGTFVIGADGVLRLAHRSRDSADYPPTDELLAVV